MGTWESSTDLWPVMVRSEIKHQRLSLRSALRSSLWAELRRDFSMLDVALWSTPTPRESAAPTPAPAESPKTSPSELREQRVDSDSASLLTFECFQPWSPLSLFQGGIHS